MIWNEENGQETIKIKGPTEWEQRGVHYRLGWSEPGQHWMVEVSIPADKPWVDQTCITDHEAARLHDHSAIAFLLRWCREHDHHLCMHWWSETSLAVRLTSQGSGRSYCVEGKNESATLIATILAVGKKD